MHELFASRGFVRRPVASNSSEGDGGVPEQALHAEKRRVDAATAERKLKSTQASLPQAKAAVFLAIELLVIALSFGACASQLEYTVFASRSRFSDRSRQSLALRPICAPNTICCSN